MTSSILALVMGPRAYASRATMPTTLTALGALMAARMGYTSFHLRHG